MVSEENLVSVRERAAVLALLGRKAMPWNQLAAAIEENGSALDLLRTLDESAEQRLFQVDRKRLTLDQLEGQVHRWSEEGIRVVSILDREYPTNLRMVHDRPPVLFVRGSLIEADERSVAVVGTRRASEAGLELGHRIATELVSAAYTVASGLAAGIDSSAHRAALAAGGRTIAVIGTGLREYFPKENAELQDRLGRETAVISQFWPDQGPRKWTFPQRNAVMSGLSRATVVVEASHTSGARMQARLAREHGRPVFLLESLVAEHKWARDFQALPGTYVVNSGEEVVADLARLYDGQLTLAP